MSHCETGFPVRKIVRQSGCGKPRKTWEQVISEDLCVKGIHRELVQNCAEWRSAIT